MTTSLFGPAMTAQTLTGRSGGNRSGHTSSIFRRGTMRTGFLGSQAESDDEPISLTDWQFPMYLVPVMDFLSMSGAPRAHQLLLRDGQLHLWQRGCVTIFVSHQWLHYRHPDPEGEQMKVVRNALDKLVSGVLTIQVDPSMHLLAGEDLPHWDPDRDGTALREAFVWYDYFSIPQVDLDVPSSEDTEQGTVLGVQDHRSRAWTAVGIQPQDRRQQADDEEVLKDMVAAVSSIPVYVSLSHVFLVVAPPLHHRSTKGVIDFESWSKRGWCRLELWSHILREGRARPMVLVRSELWAQFMTPRWYFSRVHEGELTAETDRSIIAELTDSMLTRKLRDSESHPSDPITQWFTAMHGPLVGKTFPAMSERRFKDSFGLHSLGAAGASRASRSSRSSSTGGAEDGSLPSIMCAALAGQPRLVSRCLDARCDVDALTTGTLASLNMVKDTSALQAVCWFKPPRQLEVLELLLAAHADMNHQQALGMCPLQCCTSPDAVDLLLRARADLGFRCFNGIDALGYAAGVNGAADAVGALIQHGAPLEPTPKVVGLTPLFLAALNADDTDLVTTLLANRADPNGTVQPQGLLKYVLRGLAMCCGRQLQSAVPLMRMSVEFEGATPLLIAAGLGKASVVLALLDARAALDHANWRGTTAQAWAQREGFSHLFSGLAQVAAATGKSFSANALADL